MTPLEIRFGLWTSPAWESLDSTHQMDGAAEILVLRQQLAVLERQVADPWWLPGACHSSRRRLPGDRPVDRLIGHGSHSQTRPTR